MKRDSHSELRGIYIMENIAVVDRCKNNEKAGHFVAKYLIEHEYNVIPINPTITELLGRRRSQDVPAVIYDTHKKSK
jgi:predicted CoA-binding protein